MPGVFARRPRNPRFIYSADISTAKRKRPLYEVYDMTRIVLLLAIATIALIAPAEARSLNSPATAAQQIDVAAIPAYPTANQARAGRQPWAAGRGALAGRRTAARAPEARKASPAPRQAESGSGIVRSAKTGATARVSPRYAGRFQAYVNALESGGASIYYMGGYRRGRCSAGSQHPCGMALDVCQDRRDHVSGHKNCNLPGRSELIRIAAAHGLFEGGQWCHGDMGHAQVTPTASSCGRNLYAAVTAFKEKSSP